jgi:hypothetical protein
VNRTHRTKWVTLITISSVIAGCAAPGASSSEPSLKDKAAAEATAIIQRAEATAIVLQAQATASAMVNRASGSQPALVATTPPATAIPAPSPTAHAATDASQPAAPATPVIVTSTPAITSGVELLGVGFAADTGFIMVEFKADPWEARRWMQGTVYVVDESSGTIYNEIPVMPTVGPLLGRPKEPGQVGYVMLVNMQPGIRPGSIVTVVLGDFKQEHVTVSGDG